MSALHDAFSNDLGIVVRPLKTSEMGTGRMGDTRCLTKDCSNTPLQLTTLGPPGAFCMITIPTLLGRGALCLVLQCAVLRSHVHGRAGRDLKHSVLSQCGNGR